MRLCFSNTQVQVPAHAELMWILSTVASMGYLSRMTQWKVCYFLIDKNLKLFILRIGH
jgi:tryptophanyl-tRNA synthetase